MKWNNTQISNAKDIDEVMLIYNWIEFSDNCSKSFGSLWEYCRNKAAVNSNGIFSLLLQMLMIRLILNKKNNRSNRW